MAKEINLNKSVFRKRNYNKVVDTSFKELGVKTTQQQLDEQPTVQEFFDMYNTLFYEINELGNTNSHEYLIKTSTEYVGFEEDNKLVTLLQAEISSLREQLLESKKQLSDFASLIPEAPTLPEISTPETPEIPNDPLPPTPSTPATTEPPTDEEKVISDFEKYSKSSIKKRAERLGLTKQYIKGIKKANNL